MRELWFQSVLMLGCGLAYGCTALIDVNGHQCDTDNQCVTAKLGDSCVEHVCTGSVSSKGPDAGMTSNNGMCTKDAECTAKNTPRCMNGTCVAEDIAERWACDPATPAPDTGTGTIVYTFHVLEFVSRMPPANLTVSACRENDVECTNPVAKWDDTDATGDVRLELPVGFLGFFDVHSDALGALSYLTKPLYVDTQDRDLQVVATSTLTILSSVAGVGFEPAKGLALVEAFDCTGTPAGGVHFLESQGSATPFYLVNHVPNKDATISVYDMVNNVADGGFINLQPGFITFSAQLGVDGIALGSFNAHVRANTVTYIDMYL
jgi:hypothetical protein